MPRLAVPVVAALLFAGVAAVAQPVDDDGWIMPFQVRLPPLAPPVEPEPPVEPTPAVPEEPEGWPQDGSFVTYAAHSLKMERRSLSETWQNATWTFHAGRWILSCEHEFNVTTEHGRGRTSARSGGEAGVDRVRDGDERPPFVKETSRRSTGWQLVECKPKTLSLGKPELSSLSIAGMGDGNVSAEHAGAGRVDGMPAREAWWDPSTNLQLGWRTQSRTSVSDGWLVATDAPIGAAPAEPAAVPATEPAPLETPPAAAPVESAPEPGRGHWTSWGMTWTF